MVQEGLVETGGKERRVGESRRGCRGRGRAVSDRGVEAEKLSYGNANASEGEGCAEPGEKGAFEGEMVTGDTALVLELYAAVLAG